MLAEFTNSTCDPIFGAALRQGLFSQLEGIRILMDRYQKSGMQKVSNDFYPGGRHEMLNETNRDEVMKNLLGWISALLEEKERWRHSAN